MEILYQQQDTRMDKKSYVNTMKMAPLVDLKEKRLSIFKEGTSSYNHKHLTLGAASTKRRALEMFNGTIKCVTEKDAEEKRRMVTKLDLIQQSQMN